MIGGIPNPLQAFTWGDNGQAMTPEQVARRRAMAALLQQDSASMAPVAHWTQAAARGLGGFLAGRSERIATRAENEGLASADEYVANNPILSALMGETGQALGMPQTQQAPMQAAPQAQMRAMPREARAAPGADAIRAGLVQRGLPPHVADAFVMNFQDESGLNPGIEEHDFNVHGTKGFGLAQWTGPRRSQLEAFARQRGTPVSDVNTQLDFLMSELQGSEKSAARSILSAPDAGSAAAAIVNNFLRPAEEHRARREAAYTGGGGGVSTNAAGMIQAPAQAPSGVIAALAGAQGNPWVAQKYGPVLEALMGQEMGRQDAAYQQSLAQSDPMYRAQLEAQQLANQQARMPQPMKPIEVGGVLLDPVTYQPIFDSRTPSDGGFTLGEGQVRYDASGNVIAQGAAPAPEAFRQATPEEAASYGSPAGQFGPDGRFYPVNPPTGMTIESDGKGGFRFVQGAGAQNAQADAQTEVIQADAMLNSIDEILADPALDRATGILSPTQRIPGTAAYRFGTRARQLEGQAFLQAFESLKGGGAITEIEGQKATQAIGRLDTAQSPDDYRQALEDLREVVQAGRARSAGRAGLDVPTEAAAAMMEEAQATPEAPVRDFRSMSPADLATIDLNSLTDAELDAFLEATK